MYTWQIFAWLMEDAAEYGDNYPMPDPEEDLEVLLFELNTHKEIILPENLPEDQDKLIKVLRKHFKDNVTFISLVLNRLFPEDFLFYRVSKLEGEIFEGFQFLSEIIPGFGFYFNRVGRNGFEKYLKLNDALLDMAEIHWPEVKGSELQGRICHFLYQGLGNLFLDRPVDPSERHYWIMATKPEYFESLDTEDEINWSGRKGMQEADLVFMYRTSPKKAITGLYIVKEEPNFDPWAAWDGFWVNLEKVTDLPDISFTTLRNDAIIGHWQTVAKQFHGTVTDPVPYPIYNQLLELIPDKIKSEYELDPESVAPLDKVDLFTSEADFEEKIVVPLLKGWGFKYKPKHPCSFRFGSQYHQGELDFQVEDDKGPLTLIEAKWRIRNDKDLKMAVDQAKSYALMLGFLSFLVASPEAFWLYSLDRNIPNLLTKIPTQNLLANRDELKRALLKSSGRS